MQGIGGNSFSYGIYYRKIIGEEIVRNPSIESGFEYVGQRFGDCKNVRNNSRFLFLNLTSSLRLCSFHTLHLYELNRIAHETTNKPKAK